MNEIYIQVGEDRILAEGEVLAYIIESQKIMQQNYEEHKAIEKDKGLAKSALIERLGLTEEEAKLLFA